MGASNMPHNLSIVLVKPEIPTNTGSIGRLCLATNSTLHLIEPLGFDISDSRVKRAGLDYWKHLQVIRHKSFEVFLNFLPTDASTVFFSTKSKNPLYAKEFQKGSYLIFGCETKGLGEELIEKFSKVKPFISFQPRLKCLLSFFVHFNYLPFVVYLSLPKSLFLRATCALIR